MFRRAIALLLLTSACSFKPNQAADDNVDPHDDASVDSAIDAPAIIPADASSCFGTSVVQVCLQDIPSGTVTLTGTVNTSTDATCTQIVTTAGGVELCVIAAASIDAPGTVVAIG